MKLLVFGQTGQVARELILQGAAQHDVLALGRDQADLSDPEACAQIVRESDAEAVINAAAYTAVDRAEEEEELATRINGLAPGLMARAAAEKGVPFLHISTDYVFDGEGESARRADEKVAPINAYGRSKRAGELAVQEAGGQHLILRTSWVFSRHGANFVKTMLRLAEDRDALTIVSDQIGGPTAAADIASALLQIAPQLSAGKSGGTYHYAGQPAVSWADFAREIFAISGKKVDVQDIPSASYPTPAARPKNSRLDCQTLETDFGIVPPDWRNSLHKVLSDLGYDS